jgi:zinc protease
VGNFDLAKIEQMIATWIGGLSTTNRKELWRETGVRTVEGQHKVTVRKGLEHKSSVRVLYTGDAEWNSDNRYIMRSLSQAMSIRMREILREDMGGVYGVSIGGSLSNTPIETFNSGVRFGCDPDRVDELLTAVFTEIDKIKQEGFDDETIQQVRETQIRTVEQGMERNTFWMSNLSFCLEYDISFDRILAYEERAKGLTSEMLQKAAQQYFDDTNLLTAVLYPEERQAEN